MSVSKIGTKQKLLTVATDLFGRLGLEAVSTRMIANEADVNISAISYYFNGKDNLYMECVKNLVRTKQQQIQGALDSIQIQVNKDKSDTEAFKLLLNKYIFALISVFIKDRHKTDRNIILREIISPTEAFDIIRGKLFNIMHDQLAKLILLAGGEKFSPLQAQVKTIAVMGFIRSIPLLDDALLEKLEITELDEKGKDTLTQYIMTLAV